MPTASNRGGFVLRYAIEAYHWQASSLLIFFQLIDDFVALGNLAFVGFFEEEDENGHEDYPKEYCPTVFPNVLHPPKIAQRGSRGVKFQPY